MVDIDTVIGNIQKVKWHYCRRGLGRGVHGHARESYTPEEMYITKKHPHLEDAIINEVNYSMDENKNYAYIYFQNEKLIVRNLFISSDPKGFGQKDTSFADDCDNMFILEDTNNLLLEYIKKGRPYVDNLRQAANDCELYFCVEYDIKEGFNKGLLDYIVTMNIKYDGMENRIKHLEACLQNIEERQQMRWIDTKWF